MIMTPSKFARIKVCGGLSPRFRAATLIATTDDCTGCHQCVVYLKAAATNQLKPVLIRSYDLVLISTPEACSLSEGISFDLPLQYV